MFRKLWLSLTLLAITNFSHSASGVYTFNQVGIVEDNGRTYALLQVDGNVTSVPSCAEGNSHQVSMIIEGEVGSLNYSTILSSIMANQKAWISYSDTNCGLWGTRPLVTRFDVRNH
jgi:hypothetical protein